jgi:hypothetical protein
MKTNTCNTQTTEHHQALLMNSQQKTDQEIPETAALSNSSISEQSELPLLPLSSQPLRNF